MEISNIVAIIAAIGTLVTALVAVSVYLRNSKLERAKWSLSLYEKFYEQSNLKEIRDILDNEPDHERVVSLVLEGSANFTDYLNFFEFMAFLERDKQLKRAEVKALFDYYLKCLNRHPRVLNFVRENGYEDLQKLLEQWK